MTPKNAPTAAPTKTALRRDHWGELASWTLVMIGSLPGPCAGVGGVPVGDSVLMLTDNYGHSWPVSLANVCTTQPGLPELFGEIDCEVVAYSYLLAVGHGFFAVHQAATVRDVASKHIHALCFSIVGTHSHAYTRVC